MLFIKYLLIATGFAMLMAAAAIVIRHLYQKLEYDRRLKTLAPGESLPRPLLTPRPNWTLARNLTLGSILPFLIGACIAVVPSGFGGVRVSQFSGTRPGT